MSLIPVDNTHITQAIQNDAVYVRTFLDWAAQRYNAYNQMCTTEAMTNAGIATADQNCILTFIGDLNRIITLAGGTLPSAATNIDFNIINMLGLS